MKHFPPLSFHTEIVCLKYGTILLDFCWRKNYNIAICISPETSIDHLKYTSTYHHTVKPKEPQWESSWRFRISSLLFVIAVNHITCWSLTQSRFWVQAHTSGRASRWGRGRGIHTWPSGSILRLRKGVKTYFFRTVSLIGNGRGSSSDLLSENLFQCLSS